MELNCCDCKTSFTFTASQQRSYQSKGFQNPRRCKRCKQAKKELYENIQQSFQNHRVGNTPKNAVHCSWCHNPCHSESDCRFKKSATCTQCGKIGSPASVGFAKGIRTNTVKMACNCKAPRALS